MTASNLQPTGKEGSHLNDKRQLKRCWEAGALFFEALPQFSSLHRTQKNGKRKLGRRPTVVRTKAHWDASSIRSRSGHLCNRWSETSPVPSCCRVEGAHNKSPERPGRGSKDYPPLPSSFNWLDAAFCKPGILDSLSVIQGCCLTRELREDSG